LRSLSLWRSLPDRGSELGCSAGQKDTRNKFTNSNPLDLIERYFVRGAVIELGGREAPTTKLLGILFRCHLGG
jgi:hypothetical protein